MLSEGLRYARAADAMTQSAKQESERACRFTPLRARLWWRAMRCVPLEEVDSPFEVGGKAAQLGAAIRAHLPVPPGFAIDAELSAALGRGEARDRVDLDAILAALSGRVAVRSSAVGEDGNRASFAGQHATVLNVRSSAQLLQAIETVCASASSEAALAYRRRMKIDGEPRIAVVVQRLVDADRAGVLFTKNPLTAADERLIEASWGLGESVVSGRVTPDRYRISREGIVLERTAGEKDVAVRPNEVGGTSEVIVASSDVERLCLDDASLAALNALATACEASFAGAQDIEWAFAEGRLHLLQRRPITS